MSAGTWKPGDLALITFHGSVVVATRNLLGGWSSPSVSRPLADEDVTVLRWLVVIDPEEPLDRGVAAIGEHIGELLGHGPDHDLSHIRNAVRDALRGLVQRPKPEEPTGLGAVVEDAQSIQWVRIGAGGLSRPWTRAEDAAIALIPLSWPEVTAVRVLSEGVAS